MTIEKDIDLLGIMLTHIINMVDIDETGNTIERRYLGLAP